MTISLFADTFAVLPTNALVVVFTTPTNMAGEIAALDCPPEMATPPLNPLNE